MLDRQLQITMTDATDTKRKRSRQGCAECRRRHRKCDESRPACRNCANTGRHCTYELELSFGGRAFSKSRFGKCLMGNATLVESGPIVKGKARAQFIYGLKNHQSQASSPSATTPISPVDVEWTIESGQVKSKSTIHNVEPSPTSSSSTSSLSLTRPQSPFLVRDLDWTASLLPARGRSLLEYFVHKAAVSLSCNQRMQRQICQTFVPMAVETPHLYSAIVSLAAAHRRSAGLDVDDHQIRVWQTNSVTQLRQALTDGNGLPDHRALATTLVLCLAEAVSDDAEAGLGRSWRAHLTGATSLMKLLDDGSSFRMSDDVPGTLKRIYRCLLTAGTCFNPRRNIRRTSLQPKTSISNDEEHHVIDEFLGFSTALLPIFEEIKNLDAYQSDDVSPSSSRQARQERAEQLERRVRHLLATREPLSHFDNTDDPTRMRQDLQRLDQAYHYAALLSIYNRGFEYIPTLANAECIDRVIACISAMTFLPGQPAPVAASLPPLFVAGCASYDTASRNSISHLLGRLSDCYGMGNVRSTKLYLERMWQQSSSRLLEQADEGIVSGSSFQSEIDLGAWDVLPY